MLTHDNWGEFPLFYVFFEGLKAVWVVEFVIDSKASFRVTYPFFLFCVEEQLQNVHHAAGVENSTVLWEEFSGYGRQ